ncbi:MAG TPA: phosphoribosylpyrophosphate synthetase [Bacteroidetes bacterium]|nr:phosphoribosylpyrophosphate synthetase [Bacteroidota bacterium]
MESYNTLTEALDSLKQQGYTRDFNLTRDSLVCNTSGECYPPQTFQVDRFFRFEGLNDPDDSSILYAITAEDGSRGVLVDAYGAYADAISDEMLEALRMPK